MSLPAIPASAEGIRRGHTREGRSVLRRTVLRILHTVTTIWYQPLMPMASGKKFAQIPSAEPACGRGVIPDTATTRLPTHTAVPMRPGISKSPPVSLRLRSLSKCMEDCTPQVQRIRYIPSTARNK